MTKEFEWLLESEGWKRGEDRSYLPETVWLHSEKKIEYESDLYTYEFISKIKIMDWGKYIKEISQIIEKTGKRTSSHTGYFKAFHNASLDARILALARVAGYEG